MVEERELAETSEAVQAAFGRVLRDPALRDAVSEDAPAALAGLGLDPRSSAGMLAAGPERLLAYHAMVHTRLWRTIKVFIGPAADALGDERLHADVREWIRVAGPTTAYLREVPAEFLAWARPRWDSDAALPAWVGELADHQVSIRMIRNDPRPVGSPSEAKIDIERPIVCNGTTRLVRYEYAVHRVKGPLGPGEAPPKMGPGERLIGFRSPADEQPSFLEIKARSGHMLERLLAGQTLREALFGACEVTGETLDDEILAVTAVTLAELSEGGVLLGGVA